MNVAENFSLLIAGEISVVTGVHTSMDFCYLIGIGSNSLMVSGYWTAIIVRDYCTHNRPVRASGL